MALEPGRRSVSPDSSGHDSPVPRQWRNQLGTGRCLLMRPDFLFSLTWLTLATSNGLAEDAPPKDKHYRKYASGIERALSLFDTALQEWADYISFLNRLLKVRMLRVSGMPGNSG